MNWLTRLLRMVFRPELSHKQRFLRNLVFAGPLAAGVEMLINGFRPEFWYFPLMTWIWTAVLFTWFDALVDPRPKDPEKPDNPNGDS